MELLKPPDLRLPLEPGWLTVREIPSVTPRVTQLGIALMHFPLTSSALRGTPPLLAGPGQR